MLSMQSFKLALKDRLCTSSTPPDFSVQQCFSHIFYTRNIKYQLYLFLMSTMRAYLLHLKHRFCFNRQLAIKQTKEIKSFTSLRQVSEYVTNNQESIDSYQTILLEFLNEFYMNQRSTDLEGPRSIYKILNTLRYPGVYEKTLALSIVNKIEIYFMNDSRSQWHDMRRKIREELIQDLKLEYFDYIDCFSILFVFRIERQKALTHAILKRLNSDIYSLTTQANPQGIWTIFLTQLTNLSWEEIHHLQNIINYLCYVFSAENFSTTEGLLQVAEAFGKLRLHQRGPMKLPKCLDNVFSRLKNAEKLDEVQIFRVWKALDNYPLSYNEDFFRDLSNKLIPLLTLERERFIPYYRLGGQKVKQLLKSMPIEKASIWFTFVYVIELPNERFFFTEYVMDLFEQIIKEKQTASIEELFQDYDCPKLIAMARMFLIKKKPQISHLCSKIYWKMYKQNRSNVLQNLSLSNLLTIIPLFKSIGEGERCQQILELFYERKIERQNKIKYNTYYKQVKQTIIAQISSTDELVIEVVKQLIQEMVNSQNMMYYSQSLVEIAFELLSQPTIRRLPFQHSLEKIMNKLLEKGSLLMAEYFVVLKSFNIRAANDLMKYIINSKCEDKFMAILCLLSNLPIRMLSTMRGTIHSQTRQYLNSVVVNSLPITESSVKKYAKFLRVISNFQQVEDFSKALFYHLLNKIVENHTTQNPIYHDDHNLLFSIYMSMEFEPKTKTLLLGKLLHIYQSLPQTSLITKTKVLTILCLLKGTELHNEDEELNLQIEIIYTLSKLSDLSWSGDILFILLQLHCLQKIQLKQDLVAQYFSTLMLNIKWKKFTIYNVSNSMITNENYTLESVKEKYEKYISVLLENLSNHQLNFYLSKKFIQYFMKFPNQEIKCKIINNVLNSAVYPVQLDKLIDFIRDHEVGLINLQLLRKRISSLSDYLLMSEALKILFFFEKINYQSEQSQFMDDLYQITEESLEKNINLAKRHPERKNYLLGNYSLYMWACIKSNRTEQNPIFSHLVEEVKNNKKYFLTRIRRHNYYKFINQAIAAYLNLELDKSSAKSQPFSIFEAQKNHKPLQTYMKRNKISFKRNYLIENITVPYYLPEQDAIVIALNPLHLNYENLYSGRLKFLVQVVKKRTNKSIFVFYQKQENLIKIV